MYTSDEYDEGARARLGIWDVEVRRTEDGEEGVWVRMKAGR